MLPNSEHVLSVFNSEKGLLSKLQPGSVCIDSSTIDQSISIKISQLAAEKKSSYLDAPVSGGVTGMHATKLESGE